MAQKSNLTKNTNIINNLQTILAGLEGSTSNPAEAEILQILAEWEEELKKNGSAAFQSKAEVQP